MTDREFRPGNPKLIETIRQEIGETGPIPFARFMELALYHPESGYYLAQERRPGRGGDFLTAPEATPFFGLALARQMAEFWERLGKPDQWSIREYGAGIGLLAYDILAGLASESPEAFANLTYRLVEINPAARSEAERAMAEAGLADKVVIEGDELTRITGVVLGNEILDALPVHRLVIGEKGEIRERYVSWSDNWFAWVDGELSPPVTDFPSYFRSEEISFQPGDLLDVSPASTQLLAGMIDGLQQGYLMLIDYGYQVAELYRDHRRQGTLRSYYGHVVTDDPFQRVGEQDLTAHVDFTSLIRTAEARDATFAGFTNQGALLSSLGLGDLLIKLQQDPEIDLTGYYQAQLAVARLIDPGGLGRFGVLFLARNAPVDPPLLGLREAPPDF